MELDRGTWGRFAVRVLVLGVVVFGAVRLAVARDGVAGGASRSFVTVAGTLTGVTGSGVGLTFSFRRALGDGGVAPALCAPTVATTVREGGAFSVEVPLASDASRCPDDLFDGRDVVVEVAVNGTPIDGRFAVNPVPYAIRADVAATALRAESASGGLAGLVNAGLRRIDCSWTAEGPNSENSISVPPPADGAGIGRVLLLVDTENAAPGCDAGTGTYSLVSSAFWVFPLRGYPPTVTATQVLEVPGGSALVNNRCASTASITATGVDQLNNRVRVNVLHASGARVSCTLIPLR